MSFQQQDIFFDNKESEILSIIGQSKRQMQLSDGNMVCISISNGIIDIQLKIKENSNVNEYFCWIKEQDRCGQLRNVFDSLEQIFKYLLDSNNLVVDLEGRVLKIMIKPIITKQKYIQLANLKYYNSREELQASNSEKTLQKQKKSEDGQKTKDNIKDHNDHNGCYFNEQRISLQFKNIKKNISTLFQQIQVAEKKNYNRYKVLTELLSQVPGMCEQCYEPMPKSADTDGSKNLFHQAMLKHFVQTRNSSKQKAHNQQQNGKIGQLSQNTKDAKTQPLNMNDGQKIKNQEFEEQHNRMKQRSYKQLLEKLQFQSLEIPAFIDRCSGFLKCFRFHEREITLAKLPLGEERRAVMILGVTTIKQKSVFKFKLVKCNNKCALGFGIVDTKLKAKRFCKSGSNCVRLSNKFMIFNGRRSWRHSIGSILEGQIITMKIYMESGTVEWSTDEGNAYSCTNYNIKMPHIKWVPFVQMRKIGDTIEWIE